MWELVFNLTVREADSCNKLIRHVDDSSDLDIDCLALLVELCLRLLQFLAISANEKSRHMMRGRQLPWTVSLLLVHHGFEVIDHLLGLSCLLECLGE